MKISGQVTGGNKIGRKLGFPTANIAVGDGLDVPDGVYSARVTVGGQTHNAMANLGRKPSIGGDGGRVLEVHLFDFSQDIYDCMIEVELLEFIRPERRFDSFDQLRRQIARDKETILGSFGGK